MKKLRLVAAALALTTAVGFAGCSNNNENEVPDTPPSIENPGNTDNSGGGNNSDNTNNPNNPNNPNTPDDGQNTPQSNVSVAATVQTLILKDHEVEDYNFASCFFVREDGKTVSARDYIDTSSLKAEEGLYYVTCTYKEKSATVTVKVIASQSTLTLSKSEIRINSAEVESYNFKALFTLTVDGARFTIKDSMVTTDIKAEAGEYFYTVTFLGKSETLKVTVLDEYGIEIINSYSVLELTIEELEGFDYTSLFSLYVGGVAERVVIDYIDASALENAVEREEPYPVTISFETHGRHATSTAYIKVVAETQITIVGKTIETYPNGEDIDLKTLFTVKKGNVPIEVNDDMITGSIDFSKEGDNIITLEYGGRKATATVKVRLGVILGYAASDTVLIEKGTDIDTYDFGSDFSVIINGIRFKNIPKNYFNIAESGVDFQTAGNYTVKLTVPYNTKAMGSTGVNFDYFDIEITYVVVEKKVEYTLRTLQSEVVLPAGTQKYNVYNNLTVTINGIKRAFTENKDHVDITTCYVQRVSAPIDFTSTAGQLVEIDVYVYGPDAAPVRVSYIVRIDNGVEISGKERVVFSGTTVYARDMFTITENGEEVTVTDDMVSGKIDVFNAGIYFVTATYKGVTAQAKAVVLDSAMMGTYKTLLTEIELIEDDDDYYDYDSDWGEYYTLSPDSVSSYAAPLKNLTIDGDGEIYLGSRKIEISSIVDDSTFNINYGSYDYVMHYGDGILTFDPLNKYHLGYHADMRPMVYFNENVWKLETTFEINSSENGNIFQSTYSGVTTINMFKLQSVESGKYYWYGMKAQLMAKYSSDTFYADEVFDFASIPPDFEQLPTEKCTVTLGGESYDFTMKSSSNAIINNNADTVSAFANTTFKGTVDGKSATFAVANNDAITLTVDNKQIFRLIKNEQRQLKNAGIDYNENTWLVYNMHLDGENTPYSYRFRLDKDKKTFTIDERDDLFGRYVYEKVCFFFDGYGSGEANFNTDIKYATTAFTYKRNGANIEITFRNAQPNFEYGKSAKFLLADFKNILTVREITGINLVGKQLKNAIIYDGAIIEVKNFVLGLGSYETELFEGISITTKDGKLTEAQMRGTIEGSNKRYVDLTRIGNRAGFYQLIINIPIDGEIKSSYYSVQILDSLYSDSKLVGNYYQSVISGNSSIILDTYGRISGKYSGIEFSGIGIFKGNTFTATAQAPSGSLTISGELLADGVVRVTSRGALMFTECFVSGTVKTCGTNGYILRAVTGKGETVCMLASTATSLGNIVEVEGDIEALNTILKLTDGNKEYFVKVNSWGGNTQGLVMADAVRGEYTLSDAENLFLDGFGGATLGELNGTYVAYGYNITAIFGDEVRLYRVDPKSGTYTISSKVLDETLLAGMSFAASYMFTCENDSDDYPYMATTIFEFRANGKVVVKSSSDEHDEDCNDIYSPEYATDSGLEGTFTVEGNKITVTVNEKTIVFTFTDAFGLNTITCSTTNVSPSSHGYFGTNTVFTLE